MRYRIGKVISSLASLCCLALESPPDDQRVEQELALDSFLCTLGTECERWGELREGDDATEAQCVASGEASTPPIWVQPLSDATCPFGRCTVYDLQLTLDANGSLLTLGSVQLPSQHGSGREGGLWLTHHASDGTLRDSALWDFSVPPPGIEVERHAALLRDPTGRALFVGSRAVIPFDAPRPLQVSRPFRSGTLSASPPLFSTPPGWGVTAAPGPTGEWVVGAYRTLAAGGAQASVTRYERRGRALWTRTWPVGHKVEALEVTKANAILALVADTASETHTLYELDQRGIVSWRRVVGSSSPLTQVVATQDGAIYVASLVPGDPYATVRIHKLAAGGYSLAVWTIPDVVYSLQTLSRDEAGNAMLALPSYDSDWLPTLDWYAFDDDACRLTTYQWPAESSQPVQRVAIQADRGGARFFASTQLIGQLRERGEP